jgi:hypothetical protein
MSIMVGRTQIASMDTLRGGVTRDERTIRRKLKNGKWADLIAQREKSFDLVI